MSGKWILFEMCLYCSVEFRSVVFVLEKRCGGKKNTFPGQKKVEKRLACAVGSVLKILNEMGKL